MASFLDNPKSVPVLVVVLTALAGYVFYTGDYVSRLGVTGVPAKTVHIQMMQDSITQLTAQTDSVKKDLARGTIEDLKRKIDGYRGNLVVLRQLVPDRNEVPNLLDDISTRAKIRGVNLSEVVPQPVEAGPAPFDTYAYKLSVVGRYDQIGEFLSDIASLRRIVVPYDVTVTAAQLPAAKALGDPTGAMLEAKFNVRTFVKSQGAAEGGPSGN